MKAVLISIQPYWVFLIIAKKMGWNIGKEKTIEVRKNYPKDENWNKISKIYCSKDKKSFSKIPKEYQPLMEQFLGKVIGEFVCDKIFDICIEISKPDDLPGYPFPCTGLTDKEILQYLGNGRTGYGWHISDFVIYDKPKELGEFWKCNYPFDCGVCDYFDGFTMSCEKPKRPPQSWCYVERSDNNGE